jgi:ribonuclease BN (tRNA processing enzyme)
MRVIALGVNAAFVTGQYEKVVPLEDLKDLLSAMSNQPMQSLAEEIFKRAKIAYDPCWQSNFLLEFDTPNKRGKKGAPYRLLLDCGGDVRHGLAGVGLSMSDIDGVYISHVHADHIGGMETLALVTFFDAHYSKKKEVWLEGKEIVAFLLEEKNSYRPPEDAKPDLFVHTKVLGPLRTALAPGLNTLQWLPEIGLETYFNVIEMGDAGHHSNSHTFKDGHRSWELTPIFVMHAIGSSEPMPCYGISLRGSDETFIVFPTDTQHMTPWQLEMLYYRADVVYMDCETSKVISGVHPHLSQLVDKMPEQIQKKCYLYHYQEYPDCPPNMFKGILKTGDVQIY